MSIGSGRAGLARVSHPRGLLLADFPTVYRCVWRFSGVAADVRQFDGPAPTRLARVTSRLDLDPTLVRVRYPL